MWAGTCDTPPVCHWWALCAPPLMAAKPQVRADLQNHNGEILDAVGTRSPWLCAVALDTTQSGA